MISSSQVSTLNSLINKSNPDQNEAMWNLVFKNYESKVFAVSIGDKILFANKLGDRVIFNGWDFESIGSINGVDYGYSVFRNGHEKLLLKGKQVVSRTICTNWSRESVKNLTRLSQKCTGSTERVSFITLSKDGFVESINQILDDKGTFLKISKVK